MAYSTRYEDRGLTLRLYPNEAGASQSPDSAKTVEYACGWLSINRAGRYVDAGGVLPPEWQPHTREENQAVLDRLGLTGEFWRLS